MNLSDKLTKYLYGTQMNKFRNSLITKFTLGIVFNKSNIQTLNIRFEGMLIFK